MKILLMLLVFAFGQVAFADPAGDIQSPILGPNLAPAGACVAKLIRPHMPPGAPEITEWRGPGHFSSGGEIDHSVAAYIAATGEPLRRYGVLFGTSDEDGWQFKVYQEGEQINLAMVARTLWRTALVFEVNPHSGHFSKLSDEVEQFEVDLTPCERELMTAP